MTERGIKMNWKLLLLIAGLVGLVVLWYLFSP
jgi:hypothetical protein